MLGAGIVEEAPNDVQMYYLDIMDHGHRIQHEPKLILTQDNVPLR